jgi:hypothetical protein
VSQIKILIKEQLHKLWLHSMIYRTFATKAVGVEVEVLSSVEGNCGFGIVGAILVT